MKEFDYLTGLPGMSYFLALAEAGCRKLKEAGKTPVILYIDFNGMKTYNAKHGMEEGDKLLVEIARYLSSVFGVLNCSRFSADHFVVYTENTGTDDLYKRMIGDIKGLNESKSLPVRIGIYFYDDDSITVSGACDRAKIACDTNKKGFESKFYYFEQSMMKRIEMRQYILENLDKAIEEDWIKVYHQPIIRAANGRVCNEEALVRWQDPQFGMISPGDFIEFLEDANVLYKLDLYVVDKVLRKLRIQADEGLYVVPESVNLSPSDFYACDMVEEIRKRVDKSGFDRDRLVIEITEGAISKDIDYMIEQISRFKDLGFTVWIDDYGSGYSSPLLLQKINFDLLKIDMEFVRQIGKHQSGRIILTEIVKMAIALGMETVAEGVETQEQLDFLTEIGCTKLQGYFYCKPISMSDLLERYRTGNQIGFENPDETGYYAHLGNVNLYDLNISRSDDERLEDYFDTWPMVLVECHEDIISMVRCNRTFREFVEKSYPGTVLQTLFKVSDYQGRPGMYSLNAVVQCAKDGKRRLLDDRTRDGRTIQIMLRRVAENPLKDVAAVQAVILLSAEGGPTGAGGLTYNYVARALAEDYVHLYFVNLDTEEFVEYSPDGANRDISIERRGQSFFKQCYADAENQIYKKDWDDFWKVFNKENIQKCLKENGIFTYTYRLIMDGNPVYVNMKVVKVRNKDNQIIIGINNVDVQMRHKEALEKIKEERTAYSRVIALSGDYLALYTVDPITDVYLQYSSSDDFDTLGMEIQGIEFYEKAYENGKRFVYEEDFPYYARNLQKEVLMKQIAEKGMFTMNYRLYVNGTLTFVQLRATNIKEGDEEKTIIGILNIDEQVKREKEFASKLLAAREEANIDKLTGVRNKHAYVDYESQLNNEIEAGDCDGFALVVFDINGLKVVNDTMGHQAGDQFIKEGCELICNTFAHSPVFRLGGDEFVVIAQKSDLTEIEDRMKQMAKINCKNAKEGKVVIAAGMSKYNYDRSVSVVFERADKEMYCNKKKLKET